VFAFGTNWLGIVFIIIYNFTPIFFRFLLQHKRAQIASTSLPSTRSTAFSPQGERARVREAAEIFYLILFSGFISMASHKSYRE
jgi:hypothetical protein